MTLWRATARAKAPSPPRAQVGKASNFRVSSKQCLPRLWSTWRYSSSNAHLGDSPRPPLSIRSQTNPLKGPGQRPRPNMHRRDKKDSVGKQETWQEVDRGGAPWHPSLSGEAQWKMDVYTSLGKEQRQQYVMGRFIVLASGWVSIWYFYFNFSRRQDRARSKERGKECQPHTGCKIRWVGRGTSGSRAVIV